MFFLDSIKISICPNRTCKTFENRSKHKVFMAKMNFALGFSIVKNDGREVIIFLQNFKTHSIQFLSLEIIIKCHKILT